MSFNWWSMEEGNQDATGTVFFVDESGAERKLDQKRGGSIASTMKMVWLATKSISQTNASSMKP